MYFVANYFLKDFPDIAVLYELSYQNDGEQWDLEAYLHELSGDGSFFAYHILGSCFSFLEDQYESALNKLYLWQFLLLLFIIKILKIEYFGNMDIIQRITGKSIERLFNIKTGRLKSMRAIITRFIIQFGSLTKNSQ